MRASGNLFEHQAEQRDSRPFHPAHFKKACGEYIEGRYSNCDYAGNHVGHGDFHQYHFVRVFVNSGCDLRDPVKSTEHCADLCAGNEQQPDPDYRIQLWGEEGEADP